MPVATGDSRVGALVRPTVAPADAVAAVVKDSPGARATWDARFGTPRTLTPALGRTLSGPRAGSAVDVAREWLSAHRAMLGLSAADIDALQLRRDHVLPDTGTHVVQLVQTFDGVAAARGGSLGLAVRKDGSVLSYTGETVRSGALGGFGSRVRRAPGRGREARGALAFAPSRTGTQAGYDVFAKGRSPPRRTSRRSTFPTKAGARAAYSVLFIKSSTRPGRSSSTPTTGTELYRTSLVQHEDPGGTIYDNYPGAAKGGQPRHSRSAPTAQSPKRLGRPDRADRHRRHDLRQQRQHHANWSNFIGPVDQGPAPGQPRPASSTTPTRPVGSHEVPSPPSYPQDLNPAATNLFFQHNRIHDEYYALGFTETAGNFQLDNGSNGGKPGDAIQGLVQAGAVSGGTRPTPVATTPTCSRCRRHPAVERHVPVGADRRRVRGPLRATATSTLA